MLQVERVDHHGLRQFEAITDPHGRTIEVGQQPLVGVRIERHGVLYKKIQSIIEMFVAWN